MKTKLSVLLGGILIAFLSHAVPPQGIVEIDSKWKKYSVDYGYEGGALWFGDLGAFEGDNGFEHGIAIYLDPSCSNSKCLDANKAIYEWIQDNIPRDYLFTADEESGFYLSNLGYVKEYYYFPDMEKSHYSKVGYTDPLSNKSTHFKDFNQKGLDNLVYSSEICEYSFNHEYRAMCHKSLADWSAYHFSKVASFGVVEGCPLDVIQASKSVIPPSTQGKYEEISCKEFSGYFGAVGGWKKLLEVERDPVLQNQLNALFKKYSSSHKNVYLNGVFSGMDNMSIETLEEQTSLTYGFLDRFYLTEPRLDERWLALWGQIPALQYWETFGSNAGGMPVVLLNNQGAYSAVDPANGKEKVYQKKAALFTEGRSAGEIKGWLTKYYKEPEFDE